MRLSPALLAAALAACAQQPPRPPAADPGVALRAADAAFAGSVRDRDEAAFRAFLAGDALFVGATGLLDGREAIVARWRRFLEPGGPTLRWAPTAGGGAASGDLGWTVGDSHLEARDPAGKPAAHDGRYVTVWSLRGGRWVVALDMELSPAEKVGPMARSPLRRLTSADGATEAVMGTWTQARAAGARTGAFLTVRQRAGGGWKVVHDSASAFGE